MPVLCFGQSYSDYISEGVKKGENGDYNGSLNEFNKAIELEPDSSLGYYYRGISKENSSDFKGAIADFKKFIKFEPNFSDVYINLGSSYQELKEYDNAFNSYSKSIELNPQNPKGYYYRGMLSFNGPTESINDFSKFIELEPYLMTGYQKRAFAFEGVKDYRSALIDHNRAILVEPTNSDGYYQRGMYLMLLWANDSLTEDEILSFSNLNRKEILLAASADFTVALQFQNNPYYTYKIYMKRGLTMELLNSLDNALADYDMAIDLDSENPEAYLKIAVINKYRGVDFCDYYLKSIDLGGEIDSNMERECK